MDANRHGPDDGPRPMICMLFELVRMALRLPGILRELHEHWEDDPLASPL